MFATKVLFKGATWLYKPVGGAGASFCMILNMLHIRDPFLKLWYTVMIYFLNYKHVGL